MDDRAKRIVETAVALAERDGYQAVRLRDVAATAQVALGTVYKRFASKEEILIAALEQESEKLVAKIGKKPVPGDNPQERVRFVFSALDQGPSAAAESREGPGSVPCIWGPEHHRARCKFPCSDHGLGHGGDSR